MEIKGMITAMVTPWDKDDEINEEASKQLIEKLIADGVDGLFILGTNGEFTLMSDDEKVAFAKLVVRACKGRVPVYAGAGACGTKQVIDLGNRLKEVGVDVLSIIAPYFQSLSKKEMIAHYKNIAAHIDMPILLYNIPSVTKNPISAEVVTQVCMIPNIKGIKDSSGDLALTQAYLDASKHEDFVVLIGSDSRILAALEMGAKGAVAATSNLLTKNDVAIYQNFIKGDIKEAKKCQEAIEAFRAVNKRGIQPSILKRSLSLSGIDVGYARQPIQKPSAEDDQAILEMLKQYQLV
ncbi:MAG: dihydrodipicolinate synthase family protein [Breznakia sp.]